MSDVPSPISTRETAQAATPRPKPRNLVRAKPLPEAKPLAEAEPIGEVSPLGEAKPLDEADTILISTGDTGIRKRTDVGSVVICIDTTKPVEKRPTVWGGLPSGASMVSNVVQFVVHEAPAWAVSMVIHMMTLVAMAMVAVPEPAPAKAQHLIVTPPEEQKVEEEVKEVENEQPTSLLDEETSVESVAFESTVEQEQMDIQPSDEPEAAPAAVDLSDMGLEHAPKSDLLNIVGVYGAMGISARGSNARSQLVMREGGSDSSEKAVSTALRWLANHQLRDGSWSFNHSLAPTCRGQCRNPGSLAEARNGATGLALLPFLGSGQTHTEGKYKATIRRGLSYLINHMRVGAQGGALNESGGNMYSHGLASIALCEAYAMTHDKDLLGPAQAAMDFICFAQDPRSGGWRYKPRERGDTSIVGWQLMALKSGHMANLRVPPLTVHRASLYLDSVQSDDGAAYGYLEMGKGTEATTAIGLLCRMYLGWKKDSPAMQRGVKFLSRHGPSGANMYYNYYATQVMRHWEGEEWANWNRQMRDQLVHAQAKQGHEDGSWFSGTGDNGAGPGGRLYCTAMATMILEVYYRHLPLYRAQSVDQDFPD